MEQSDQYRTIKVKKCTHIREDKSESEMRRRIHPRLQLRPRAAGRMSRRKKEAEAEEKKWVGG